MVCQQAVPGVPQQLDIAFKKKILDYINEQCGRG